MKKLSITRKVTYTLIAVTTLIIGLFGTVNYITSAQKSAAYLQKGSEIVASRVALNATLPLWNMDTKQAREIIQSEMTWPDVYAVIIEEVSGNDRKIFAAAQRAADWKPMEITAPISGKYITSTQSVRREDKEIGRITVHLSDRFLQEELRQLLIYAFIQALLIDVCIIVALQIIMKRSLVNPLQEVIRDLSDSSGQLTKASVDLTHSGVVLSAGANEQAAAVEEITASLEELSSMTRTNNDNAAKGKALASESRQSVTSGVEQMRHMSSSMDTAREHTDELKKQMEAMKVASDGISKIIKTINEIAFQTNILALNASVEAARAGQAGLGFAVVADEVRNLAQRAATAARETEQKISTSIQASQEGARISEKVAESLHGIIQSVQAVDLHLKQIASKSSEVDHTMVQIADASEEQTQGIALITRAIHNTDAAIQTGAAQAQETASCAEEISGQAKALNQSVIELLELIGQPIVKMHREHPGVGNFTQVVLPGANGARTPKYDTATLSLKH